MTSLKSIAAMMTAIATVLMTTACEDKPPAEPKRIAAPPAPVAAATIVGASAGADAAQVKRANQPNWQPAKSGEAINVGDSVSVPSTGAVMVRLARGDNLSLNAGTVITLLSPNSLDIASGEIWIESGLSAAEPPLLVKTKWAETRLQGAAAGIRVNDQALTASLVTGSAVLKGSFGELAVRQGQEAVVDDKGARIVHIKDPSGLVAWTRGLRDALSPARDGMAAALSASSGLGTLVAQMPGGGAPLPFQILAEEVTVRVQDQVALTRVEQVFKNPTNQVVEATYKFPLPSGAKLTRYDMEIRGRMMQGEIVERTRGRQIMKQVIKEFEDRMRDPALVEWESGSTFKTRIFPIQAKEEKRIVLSYIETLDGAGGQYRYVLPVAPAGGEAPRIPRFRLNAEVGSASGMPAVSSPLYPATISAKGDRAVVDFTADNFEPQVDFAIRIDQPGRPEAALATFGPANAATAPIPIAAAQAPVSPPGEMPTPPVAPTPGVAPAPAVALSTPPMPRYQTLNDNYFMLHLVPNLPESAARDAVTGTDWILLADTSKSRSQLDMEIQKRLLDAFVGIMGPSDRVKVMAYDMFPRPLSADWQAPGEALRQSVQVFMNRIVPDGATNLEGALRAAAWHADRNRPTRIIVLGDGAATLGENRPGPLSQLSAGLLPNGSVTTVGVGSSVDAVLFEAVGKQTGGKHFAVSSGEDLLAAAVRIVAGLRSTALESPTLAFEGLEVFDVYPKQLQNLLPGEEVVVTGRYRGAGRLTARLRGTVNGTPWERPYTFDISGAKASNTFIPLLWASRRIDDLTLRDDEASIRQTVALSKKFSIPSRHTSFIVLENKAMHREFGVAQTSDRIEWTGEEEVEYETSDQDALGGLGSVAIGGSGAGVGARSSAGSSAAMGAAPKRAPIAREESSARAKSSKSKKIAGPPLDMFDDGYGGRPSRPRCTPRVEFNARIWRIPDNPKAKDTEEIAELRAKIASEPLSRRLRRELVKRLIRFGQYQQAAAEAAAWLQMDSTNPSAVTYTGDLTRLSGNLQESLRIYSGILDIKPEARGIMDMLASYYESKGRWSEAYPFRLSRLLVKQTDQNAAARAAITAHRAGYNSESRSIVSVLTRQGVSGGFTLNPGVKLSKDVKTAIIGIATQNALPPTYEQATPTGAAGAKMKIEAHWNTPQNLDLWVSKRGEKFIGGSGSKARLISGEDGTKGEILYMPSADTGKYKVQVVCAEPSGCGNVSGTLDIKVHGTRRSVPFTLTDSVGGDAAIIYVEKYRTRCRYDYYD